MLQIRILLYTDVCDALKTNAPNFPLYRKGCTSNRTQKGHIGIKKSKTYIGTENNQKTTRTGRYELFGKRSSRNPKNSSILILFPYCLPNYFSFDIVITQTIIGDQKIFLSKSIH